MFRLKPHPRQTVAAVVKVCRLWLGRSGVEKCRVDHKIGSKTFKWAEGFGLKVRTSDVRYRQDGIDARVIAGMMSSLRPVEDVFLHFRTGIQTDTLATMRRPMVNRFLLEETWIKAMDIDIKTELEIAKLFNYRIKSVSNELADCKSFHDLYWTEAMTPFLVTRIQFYTSPAGSTVRPAFWFSRHNALAMRVFYEKVESGKGLSLGVAFTGGNPKGSATQS